MQRWLVITSGDSGTGTSGTIAYTVATNTVAAAAHGDDHRERPDPRGDPGGRGLRRSRCPRRRRRSTQRAAAGLRLGHDQRRRVRLERKFRRGVAGDHLGRFGHRHVRHDRLHGGDQYGRGIADGDDHRERPDPCGDAGGRGLRGRVDPATASFDAAGGSGSVSVDDQRRRMWLVCDESMRRGW